MFLARNSLVLQASGKAAFAALLLAVPAAAWAKPADQGSYTITDLKTHGLSHAAATLPISLSAAARAKGTGKGKAGSVTRAKGSGKGSASSAAGAKGSAAKSSKRRGAPNKVAKRAAGGKTSGKNTVNMMVVLRGTGVAVQLYPKGRQVALNARICLKKGFGSLTFLRKAGGVVTYGDGGCNVVTSATPASGKKTPGAWGP